MLTKNLSIQNLLLHCSILIGTMLLLTPSTKAQLSLSTAIPIATNDWGNTGPKIAIADGHPLVFWGRSSGGTGELIISKYDGSTFETPQVIAIGGSAFVNAAEGPQLAATGDKAYISFTYAGTDGAYSITSIDGGANWMAPVRVDSVSHNPVLVGINSLVNGQPIYTYLNNEGAGKFTYRISQSDDFGVSWSEPIAANTNIPGGVVCECCPATVLGSGDSVFLQIRNNNSNLRDVWTSRSTDGGLSFPDATDIDDTDWIISGCPASGPHGLLGPSEMFAVYMSGASSPSQVHYARVDRNSMSFIGGAPLKTESDWSQNLPRIAGGQGKLASVWAESKAGSKRVRMAWSISGADGLPSNVVSVGDSTNFPGYPDITWDGSKFHIVYAAAGKVYYQTATISGTNLPVVENLVDKVYPNPSNGNIQIEWPEAGATVTLNDLSGRLVQKWTFHTSGPYKLEALPKGNYLLEINSANHKGSQLLLVK